MSPCSVPNPQARFLVGNSWKSDLEIEEHLQEGLTTNFEITGITEHLGLTLQVLAHFLPDFFTTSFPVGRSNEGGVGGTGVLPKEEKEELRRTFLNQDERLYGEALQLLFAKYDKCVLKHAEPFSF
jgi:hypothetical protein